MIALGLTSADLKLFNASLCTHHSVKVTVQILTLGHAYVGDLTDNLIDGQVSIDADAEVTRSLTMQLRDPDGSLKLDSTSPNDGALFYDRMVRVIYSVKSELLPRWVDVSIFCGPITKMSRTQDVINLECQGKESLTVPPTVAYINRAWGKGVQRAALVRAIMRDYGGETKFSVPDAAATTPGVVAMSTETNMWALAKSVSGAGYHLFYDGRGVLVRRQMPATATYTFRTRAGGNVTTVPTIDYDVSAVRNIARVVGAIPKGKKTPVAAVAALPRSHPLNAYALGRNGKPRVLLDILTDDNLKTQSQAQAVANARIKSLALQSVDVQFDALVAPHLEPNDIYTLSTEDFTVNARYKRATIPLKQAVGSVGYLGKFATNKTRIRRR